VVCASGPGRAQRAAAGAADVAAADVLRATVAGGGMLPGSAGPPPNPSDTTKANLPTRTARPLHRAVRHEPTRAARPSPASACTRVPRAPGAGDPARTRHRAPGRQAHCPRAGRPPRRRLPPRPVPSPLTRRSPRAPHAQLAFDPVAAPPSRAWRRPRSTPGRLRSRGVPSPAPAIGAERLRRHEPGRSARRREETTFARPRRTSSARPRTAGPARYRAGLRGSACDCTVAQLRRFIKSRPLGSHAQLRRRFGISGAEAMTPPTGLVARACTSACPTGGGA